MKRTKTDKLEVVYRPVETLIPYARNSRTHSDAQVAQIAGSIKEFGFTNPVLLDGDSGIIAGHGRVLAARKLKMVEVPCLELAHLTDAQKRAYVITDNKLALNAGWDDEMLRLEFTDLAIEGLDTALTGFDSSEIARLLSAVTDPPPLEGSPVGADEAWNGMPDFEQQNKMAFRDLIVHFACQSDVDAFAKLVGQGLTDKTKYIWFPEVAKSVLADKRYVSEK